MHSLVACSEDVNHVMEIPQRNSNTLISKMERYTQSQPDLTIGLWMVSRMGAIMKCNNDIIDTMCGIYGFHVNLMAFTCPFLHNSPMYVNYEPL